MPSKRVSIYPIVLTVFIQMMGNSMVTPIFAVLIISASGVFYPLYDQAQRNILYGVLLTMYPLAQFFGAPVIGALSDRFGRKKLIMVSIFGTLVSYVIIAIGIATVNIGLILVGKLVDGFTGGDIAVVNSAVADISDAASKPKNFGAVGMGIGFGLIVGPFLGGILSNPAILPWFTALTPFYLGMALVSVNLLWLTFRFPETSKEKKRTPVTWKTGFRNLKKAFSKETTRSIFAITFLWWFGFNFFLQFMHSFLIQKFGFDQLLIGVTFGYIGIWVASTQGFFIRPALRFVQPRKLMRISLLTLSLGLGGLLLMVNPWFLLIVAPCIAISNGLTMPMMTTMVSNSVGREEQGEILGINQSVLAVAQMLPPLLAGVVATVNVNAPIALASAVVFCAWMLYMRHTRSISPTIVHV
ncbi:MAG: MFS transporter [bacterium]